MVLTRNHLQHLEGPTPAETTCGHRISLEMAVGRRTALNPYGSRRQDGIGSAGRKHSIKVPMATATQIAERIRRWLAANT